MPLALLKKGSHLIMYGFNLANGVLHADDVSLIDIAAAHGTPTYVYSKSAIEERWHALDQAFGSYPHSIHYAVKANSNIAVLSVLAQLGSGFDIVSGGELYRVLEAGGDASKVVFSGVAKSVQDIRYALEKGVGSINVESLAELERIQTVAQDIKKTARIALRVNPNVDPQTHPYISTGLETAKFGIPIESAVSVYEVADAMSHVEVHSVACHIGSQITKTSPFSDAIEIILDLVEALANKGIRIQQLDLGGGLGIQYKDESPPAPSDYINSMLDCIKKRGLNLPVAIEPGRTIVGNAGVLLTRVEYLKTNSSKNGTKHFCMVDAGMNDLMRPALYQAYHDIVAVTPSKNTPAQTLDVVGPVCESADVLGADRELSVVSGDLLAIKGAGAYSFVMASNYNSRPRPCEIMVDGTQTYVVRKRESLADLVSSENTLPSL